MIVKSFLYFVIGLSSLSLEAARTCKSHLAYTVFILSPDIKNFPTTTGKIVDSERSALSENEKKLIIGSSSEVELPEQSGRIFRYLAAIKWNPDHDPKNYKNLFNKQIRIARDLFYALYLDTKAVTFAEGTLPSGEVYFMGTEGHFLLLKKNGRFYKGRFSGHFTQRALLQTPMTELKADYEP